MLRIYHWSMIPTSVFRNSVHLISRIPNMPIFIHRLLIWPQTVGHRDEGEVTSLCHRHSPHPHFLGIVFTWFINIFHWLTRPNMETYREKTLTGKCVHFPGHTCARADLHVGPCPCHCIFVLELEKKSYSETRCMYILMPWVVASVKSRSLLKFDPPWKSWAFVLQYVF